MDDLKDYVDLAEDIRACPWIVEKIKTSKTYAQNVYAALCNVIWRKQTEFLPALSGKDEWSCSWRWAGGFVAEVEAQGGDYMDWYCSGIGNGIGNGDETGRLGYVAESVVTEEIENDFLKLGWKWEHYEDQGI